MMAALTVYSLCRSDSDHKSLEERGAYAARMAKPAQNDTIFEVCVLCGAPTDVRIDEPIENRKAYMPGAGQLCDRCCGRVYGTDDLRAIWE